MSSTSESMLLIVGLTKSVMVTVISGMRKIFTLKKSSFLSLTLDMNLFFMWKVLQGIVQGDLSWPRKTLIQLAPENQHYTALHSIIHVWHFKSQMRIIFTVLVTYPFPKILARVFLLLCRSKDIVW